MALGSMSYGEARTCATELGNAASEMDNLFSQLKNKIIKFSLIVVLFVSFSSISLKNGNTSFPL